MTTVSQKLIKLAKDVIEERIDPICASVLIRNILVEELDVLEYEDLYVFINVHSEVEMLVRQKGDDICHWQWSDVKGKEKELEHLYMVFKEDVIKGCCRLIQMIEEHKLPLGDSLV